MLRTRGELLTFIGAKEDMRRRDEAKAEAKAGNERPKTDIFAALARVPPVPITSLEGIAEFALVVPDPETLAEMPGTPAQVLVSQFVFYARKSFQLAEAMRRDAGQFELIRAATMRLEERR